MRRLMLMLVPSAWSTVDRTRLEKALSRLRDPAQSGSFFVNPGLEGPLTFVAEQLGVSLGECAETGRREAANVFLLGEFHELSPPLLHWHLSMALNPITGAVKLDTLQRSLTTGVVSDQPRFASALASGTPDVVLVCAVRPGSPFYNEDYQRFNLLGLKQAERVENLPTYRLAAEGAWEEPLGVSLRAYRRASNPDRGVPAEGGAGEPNPR